MINEVREEFWLSQFQPSKLVQMQIDFVGAASRSSMLAWPISVEFEHSDVEASFKDENPGLANERSVNQTFINFMRK